MKKLGPFVIVAAVFSLHADAQSKPVDLSLGWNYAYNDEGNGFADLNGWYGTLIWEVTKPVGLAFSHESFWGSFQETGTNQHVWLGGLSFKLRRGDHKVNPFLQPFGGVTRSSASGSVQDEPTFQLVGGADITLKGNLSLEVVPAEYTLTYSNGSALNTYQAAAGFAYTFGK